MGITTIDSKKEIHGLGENPIILDTSKNVFKDMKRIPDTTIETAKISFDKIQREDFRDAYNKGRKIEFECFSPYLQDYNTKTGEVRGNNLSNGDAIGIEIAKMLWEQLPGDNVQQVMLYDEYNNELSNSSDPYGKPARNVLNKDGLPIREGNGEAILAPQLGFSLEAKKNFKKNLESLLAERGVINKERKLLSISESEKIKDAEIFVQKLKQKERNDGKSYILEDGKKITFINPQAENPEYKEIVLKTANGRRMCEALDASSYIKPWNLGITHLVILPQSFRVQQDKVWEMLRVLGIKPDHYHNIFFDPSMEPKEVARIIKREMDTNKPE